MKNIKTKISGEINNDNMKQIKITHTFTRLLNNMHVSNTNKNSNGEWMLSNDLIGKYHDLMLNICYGKN